MKNIHILNSMHNVLLNNQSALKILSNSLSNPVTKFIL